MAEPRITLSAVDRTGAAFASAKRNLEGLLGSANAIGARLGPILGTVGLLGSALSAVSFTNIVRGIDALNDTKDATGASIENLSALEDIAARTGTNFGTVESALVKLNGVLKDADPKSPAAMALQDIGLSVTQLRELDPAEALRQVSVALSGYADDGKKAQLSQELFGRSIKEVAPLLNDLARAGQLNATVTTEQAEQAEKFNQQLASLEKSTLDFARALAGPVVDGINAFFGAVKGGADDFEKLSAAAQFVVVPLQALTVLGANVAFVLNGIGREIGGIAAQAAALARLDFAAAGEIRAELIVDGEKARKELDEFERRILGLSKPQTVQLDGQRAIRQIDNAQLPRASAPGIRQRPTGGGRGVDQLSLLRTELQRREQIIQSSLSNEQDILRFTERFVSEVYRSGISSLESTFEAQAELRRRNVEEIRRASEETIRAEEAFQEGVRSKKPRDTAEGQRFAAELEASERRIAEAQGRVAAAERDAQQQADLAAVQKGQQTQALRQEVDAFNAALTDLADGGRSRAGELVEIATRVRAAQELLIQSGVPEPEAQADAQRFGALLEQQRQFNLLRDEFARITDRARDAEDALLLAQERNGTGLAEGQRQVFLLRQQELAQLDKLIDKTRELAAAAAQRNGGIVPEGLDAEIRRLELARQRLAQVLDPQRLRAEQSADNIGDAIANGLERAIVEGEKLSDIIKSLDREIVAIVTREVITEPLAKSVSNFIKQGFTDGGGNILQQLLGGLGLGGGLRVPGIAGGQIAVDAATGAAQAAASATPVVAAITASSTAEVAAVTASEATGTAAIVAAITAGSASIVAAIAAQAATNSLTGAGGFFNDLGGFEILGSLGFAEGGYTGAGGKYEPAGIVHRGEVVWSQLDVARAGGVGVVEAMRLGLPGYAEGGAPGHVDVIRSIGTSTTALSLAINAAAVGLFEDAERYHSGGIAGLAPDEVPAILRRGEEVLTQADPRHRDNGGGGGGTTMNYSPTFVLPGPVDKRTQEQLSRASFNGAQRATARGTAG
jgi:hypothetical protein